MNSRSIPYTQGMRFFTVFFLTNLFVISCATRLNDLTPPQSQALVDSSAPETLERLLQPDTPRNKRWWALYKSSQQFKATPQQQTACTHLVELALEPEFPLQKIARLRAFQTCPLGSEELLQLGDFDWSNMPPWLKSEALDVGLRLAEFKEDKLTVMELSFEKSKANLPQEEKVALTERALEMARALKLTEQVTSFQARIYQLAPRLNPKPQPDNYLTVAHDFRRAREFDQARSFYGKVLQEKNHSFAEKVSALRGIRTAYKNERRMDNYLKATDNLADFVEQAYLKQPRNIQMQKSYHDVQLESARSHWTHNRLTQAQQGLNEVIEQLKGRYPLYEVYWIFGRMAEEKQEFQQALEWFDKALEEKSLPAEFRERLLWFKAWNLRKVDQLELAIETLEELKSSTTSDFHRARYVFWLARSLEQTGDKRRAQREYRDLIRDDPLGYYGLLAFRQLGQKVRPAKQKPPELSLHAKHALSSRDPANIDEVLDRNLVEWLISVDEVELAKAYLDFASAAYSKQGGPDSEVWLVIFKYYALAGQYLSLYETIGRLPPEQRQEILTNNPQLLFPRPHLQVVDQWAREFNISPQLIYAVMRQESAFNPRARSHADAFGLMQLLPSVARQTTEDLARQRSLNIAYQEAEDLYLPEVNIALGAAHLRELLDRSQDQFILAVASYNASEKAIRGWLNTRFRGDTLEFIEDIPYEETRGYVRLVMRNQIFYQWLLAHERAIPFPEELLTINP